MRQDAVLALVALLPLAAMALRLPHSGTQASSLQVAEGLCTFFNDTTLFHAEPSSAAAVLAVLPTILSHGACCRACAGDWADAVIGSCHAFTWDAIDMVCTLFRTEPDELVDRHSRRGFVSGQLAGAPKDPLRSMRRLVRSFHRGQLKQVPEKWSSSTLLLHLFP